MQIICMHNIRKESFFAYLYLYLYYSRILKLSHFHKSDINIDKHKHTLPHWRLLMEHIILVT
jgi:hypothetical protein